MRLQRLTFSLLMLLAPLAGLRGQSDTVAVERASVVALVQRVSEQVGTQPIIAINPLLLKTSTVPSHGEIAVRDTNRHQQLVRDLNATSQNRTEFIACLLGHCPDRIADALVTMGLPAFDGFSAVIAVQVEKKGNRQGHLHYEALRLKVRRVKGEWNVIGVERIGMS